MNRLRSGPLPVVQLREALGSAPDPRPDSELLDRFARYADHPAFEVLVRRHGPMVFGVCRRVLGNAADADDAFQAAFLVLIRKARGLRHADRLGPWLYGVACRVALKARAHEARRAALRTEALDMIPDPSAPPEIPDWLPILDAELNALPAKYRDALVLCELQGTPRAEAAKALGVPEGTLSSRLSRGRTLLRKRLLKHGTLLPAGGLSALFSASSVGRATVPAALLARTSELAKVATGAPPAGTVPVGAARLTDEVLKGMLHTKLRLASGVFALFALVAVGLSAAAIPSDAPGAPPDKSAKKGTTAPGAKPPAGSKMSPPVAPEVVFGGATVAWPALTDRDALQGLWVLEKWEVLGTKAEGVEQQEANKAVGKHQILVAGDTWWNLRSGESVIPESAVLDERKNPKWLDLRRDVDRPALVRTIYELDGDRLRVCSVPTAVTDSGDQHPTTTLRPAEFTASAGEPVLDVRTFRREKLPPPVGEKALLGEWVDGAVVLEGGSQRKPDQTVEILGSHLFAFSTKKGRPPGWIGGKYTVDATKNPKWIDVELVAPLDDGKITKLYGCYEVADGRLQLVLGVKRATRPLEFEDVENVLLFDLKPAKPDAPKPAEAPAPKPKGASGPPPIGNASTPDLPKLAPAPTGKAKDEWTQERIEMDWIRGLVKTEAHYFAYGWLRDNATGWKGARGAEGKLLRGVTAVGIAREVEKKAPDEAAKYRSEAASLFRGVIDDLNAVEKVSGATEVTRFLRRQAEIRQLQCLKPIDVLTAADPLLKKYHGTTEELIVRALMYHAYKSKDESARAADTLDRMKTLFEELKGKSGAFPDWGGEYSKPYWEKVWFPKNSPTAQP